MSGASPNRRAEAVAVAAALLTVSFQLAGKSTRDALFLSTLGVANLPRMLLASAVTSLLVTIGLTRLMGRIGPGRLVPSLFWLSAAGLLVEWALAGPARPVAAVLLYLHFAGLGALLVSGFWAMVTERFDPRTARTTIARVTVGASVGGLLGGILPERVGAALSLTAMLPIMALLHFAAGCLVLELASGAQGGVPPGDAPAVSPRSALRGSGYLRGVALLVAMLATSEGLLDYVFKAATTAVITDGRELLRLFAAFYTGTAILTILVQLFLLRPLVGWLGVARGVRVLPAGVTLVAAGGVLVPGFGTLMAARALEMVLRNSVFRTTYEMLFTPVPARERRATKLLLDVGASRAGDATAAALTQAALGLGATIVPLLGLTMVVAVGSLIMAARLGRGYIRALERSLTRRAGDLPPADEATALLQSFGVIDLTGLEGRAVRPTPEGGTLRPESPPRSDATPQDPLASPDPEVVRQALLAGSLEGEQLDRAIELLAWDTVAPDAIQALRRVGTGSAARLGAHLIDPAEDFAVRRRLARVLGHIPGEAARGALVAALHDARFEVRYQAGRALARRQGEGRLEQETVIAAVLREVAVERGVWESRQLIDQVDDAWSPMETEVLRDRATRSLEHVFTLLSLTLPAEPLRLAFHSLYTDDANLRGTALEYLESVLPEAVRTRLWPFLEAEGRPRSDRSPDLIVQDLLASRESIVLALAAVRQRSGN